MAQFERSLIQERVRGGLRNARAKGKRLGRPPKALDTEAIAVLRREGLGWRTIARQLGVGVGTLYRVAPDRSKIREEVFGTRQGLAELLKEVYRLRCQSETFGAS